MKNTLNFISIVFIYLFIELISKKALINNELIYNFYSEQLAKEQIYKLLENQQKWAWVGYVLMPIIVLIRTSLVSICLSIGLFLYNTDDKTKFNQLFKIAIVGEFVLVLVGFVKLIYFFYIKTNYTLEDIQQFYPLSYTNLLNLENLEPWLIYPLQTINLFEIGYFFVLVFGLNKLLKNKFTKSFEIVAVSYGTGLIIWLGLIMFLTLNIS